MGEALASYRRAVAALQSIPPGHPGRIPRRPLLVSGSRLARSTWSSPISRCKQARSDPAQAPALMREARDTIEALKESELQDYYRDSCVANFAALKQSIDTVAPAPPCSIRSHYPIGSNSWSASARSSGNSTIPVPATTLKREVQQFRELLEKRTTNEYLTPAQLLYDQVIRPLDPLLTEHHVDTLVVVPDDIFRIIPFGALHDGHNFLVDRYATAIAPSMHLVAPKPAGRDQARCALLGISNSVDGFVGLPNVVREVDAVHRIEGGQMMMTAPSPAQALAPN